MEAEQTYVKMEQVDVAARVRRTQTEADVERHGRINTSINNTDVRAKTEQCLFCGKLCRPQDIKRHVLAHTPEKPFSCTICNKGFTRKLQLTNHMMTHSGERPFRCPLCNRGYIEKAMLNRHMKTHTGVKPFSCSVCDKGFYRRPSLIRHMKTHSGVQ